MISRRTPWVRALAEGIVIVGSILLAFTIVAWWERQTERQDVIQALQAVETELTENRAYFDAALSLWPDFTARDLRHFVEDTHHEFVRNHSCLEKRSGKPSVSSVS